MRKRSLSLSQRGRSKKGVFSSLKGLDTLTKRGHEKKPSVSQVLHSLCLIQPVVTVRRDTSAWEVHLHINFSYLSCFKTHASCWWEIPPTGAK